MDGSRFDQEVQCNLSFKRNKRKTLSDFLFIENFGEQISGVKKFNPFIQHDFFFL